MTRSYLGCPCADCRDHWREQAQRLALPAQKPVEKPMTWWRWLRTTGCFAGAGLLLALSTVAAGAQQQEQQQQPPQRECFAVEMTRGTQGGSLGAILLDRCTGKSWLLARTSVRGSRYTVRWHPITVESTESVSGGPGTAGPQ